MKNMCAGVLRCVGFAVWVFLSSTALMAQVAVTTYHNDNYRSGSNPQETVLTLSNVRTQAFGKRATFAVQGYVYAQPLYLPGLTIGGTTHNVLFVATEHDQVYAFDVNSGQQLWRTNFLSTAGIRYVISPVSSGDVSCGDLVPEIGITGTPAMDTTTGTMYLVARRNNTIRSPTPPPSIRPCMRSMLRRAWTKWHPISFQPPHTVTAPAPSGAFSPLTRWWRRSVRRCSC